MSHTRYSRRQVASLLAAAALAPAIVHSVSAQGNAASPTASADWASLGLPTLNLTYGVDAIEGVPESLEAGRYLVTVAGDTSAAPLMAGVMFLRLPEGMTIDDAMTEAAGATGGPPPFYFDSHLAGGGTMPGGLASASVQYVIDLPGGTWIVAGNGLSRPPVPLTVTGEMPTDLPEPATTTTIDMTEFAFSIPTDALVAGTNMVKVINSGKQIHFIEYGLVPDGTTREQVEATFHQEMTGTPVDGALDMSSMSPGGLCIDQSPGTTVWVPLTFEVGTHLAMCWVPDPETMELHAMSGMYEIFTIDA